MSYEVKEGEILLFITSKGKVNDIVRSLGAESLGRDEAGAPYLVGASYAVSLSHKGDVVAFALSNAPVGVDVEDTTVPRNVERLSKLFHETEKPTTLYDFYKVWTAKEAYGKLLKSGITTEILRAATPAGHYVEWGDYVICVMGEGDVKQIEQ